jgi:hypothetical protein
MELFDIFRFLKVNQKPDTSFDEEIAPINSSRMRRSQWDKEIHFFFILTEVFDALTNNNSAERVSYEVNPFVGVIWMFDMLFDLICQWNPQKLDWFVHLILNGITHQAIAVVIVHLQAVFSNLKIEIASLIPVYKNN